MNGKGWAVISGSGLLAVASGFEAVATPESRYGAPSAAPRRGRLGALELLTLGRHGEPGPGRAGIAPHRINYRANIDVLAQLGVGAVVALNTVGGIGPDADAGRIVIPDQLIDYSWGREQSFSDEQQLLHAEFTEPFDAALRRGLLAAAQQAGVAVADGGVYGCTQGPRLETAAEIDRMERDGCALVGMTGMPEAGLARERGMRYAMLSLVVNPAAGRAGAAIDLEAIPAIAQDGMERIARLLDAFFDDPLLFELPELAGQ